MRMFIFHFRRRAVMKISKECLKDDHNMKVFLVVFSCLNVHDNETKGTYDVIPSRSIM